MSAGSETNDPDPIVGHKTFSNDDGSYRHEPLRKSEADAIISEIEASQVERRQRIPDQQAALRAMMDGWIRLTELGWREIMYCPKDETHFDAISAGSTGIHETWYQGTWPDGHWYCFDGGDVWPTHPILFRSSAPSQGDKE